MEMQITVIGSGPGGFAAALDAEGTLTLRMGAAVGDLASTIHAHPTLSEAVMEAAASGMRPTNPEN